MFPLVEFPELIQHYAPFFDGVFSADAFIEFQRYISGLVVSENKTVDGINRLFVFESRNQSSLNRLLTQSPFSLDVLNQKRLALLASLPGMRLAPSFGPRMGKNKVDTDGLGKRRSSAVRPNV
jgi:hypothetical protein